MQVDKKRRHTEFFVDDLVLVKLQPYKQHSCVLRNNQNPAMRYFGPFEKIDRIRKMAYKLKLHTSAMIHLIFHLSVLKPFQGDASQPYMPISLLTNEKGAILQLIKVLGSW